MRLNNFFDKIVCINLDHRKDRWDDCVKQFEQYNLEVERFSAVYGKDLPDDIRKGKLLDGEIGILCSHIELIKKAKQEGVKNLLIFEDDVVLTDDFNTKFDYYSKQIPSDMKMLYLGGNHIWGSNQITENIHRIHHSYAIHAIGIKSELFDIIINGLETYMKAVDVFYAELQAIHTTYVTKPHLCWQKPDFSDIQGGFMDYPFLK